MTTTWHENMTGWHKSTYTHWEENACVEVGGAPGLVGIRDTKQWALPDRSRPILVVPAASFSALLDHLGR
ncbi:DUF397 domain-containing protein [Amycolatopsis thailandensis]|uniref:DUF397 domain-containing protein n=1 Tax=Amycolatopsis thailandensis TaxID=589330 RepID=UPI003645CBC3